MSLNDEGGAAFSGASRAMASDSRSSRVLEALTAALIGLTCIAPFINPFRVQPSGAFYSEALAAAGILLAIASSVRLIERRARVDGVVAAGAAALAALIGLQVLRGQHDYVMTWAAWLLMLALFVTASTWGQLVARSSALTDLVLSRLAWGYVLAGTTTFALQAVQLAGIASLAGPFIVARELTGGCRIAGNVGQANHANSVMWMGIVAVGYLLSQRRLHLATAIPILAFLLLGSALTASRATWVFLGTLVAFAVFQSTKGRLFSVKPLLLALALGAAAIAAALIAGYVTGAQCDSSIARFTSDKEQAFNSLRWEITRQAINVWLANPIGGAGAGRLYAESFFTETSLSEPHRLDFFAHNIVLELLAATGLAGFMVAAIVAAVWLVRVARAWQASAGEWMALSWIGILLGHSMLEQPLMHAYFLIPFGIAVGLLAAPRKLGETSSSCIRNLLGAAALVSLAVVSLVVVDYHRLGHLMTTVQIARDMEAQTSDVAKTRLAELRRGIWLHDALADFILYELELPSSANIDRLRPLNQMQLRIYPNPSTIGRSIVAAAVDGNADEAHDLLRRLDSFFPAQAPAIRKALFELSSTKREYEPLKTYLEAAPVTQ